LGLHLILRVLVLGLCLVLRILILGLHGRGLLGVRLQRRRSGRRRVLLSGRLLVLDLSLRRGRLLVLDLPLRRGRLRVLGLPLRRGRLRVLGLSLLRLLVLGLSLLRLLVLGLNGGLLVLGLSLRLLLVLGLSLRGRPVNLGRKRRSRPKKGERCDRSQGAGPQRLSACGYGHGGSQMGALKRAAPCAARSARRLSAPQAAPVSWL
jgi:hypothetical protein